MQTSTTVRRRPIKTSLPPEYRADHAGNQRWATFLGIFSLGLGLTELLAAQPFSQAIGVRKNRGLVPAYGVREIASGIGILAQRRPVGWLWGRVAGDVLDLATLSTELPDSEADRRRRVFAAMAAVAGVTLLDIASAKANARACS